jgi:hypothetical protein
LSEDSTKPFLAVPKEELVQVNITKRKEKVVVNDFVIIK